MNDPAVAPFLCPDCGGSGIASCCDGAGSQQPEAPHLTPAEIAQDGLESYETAIRAIAERVKAGEPIPESSPLARKR